MEIKVSSVNKEVIIGHERPTVLIGERINPTGKKAGLPHICFHDLRHTHATLLLKGGIHPKIVSERLGHANIGITLDTYSYVLPGLQERAAEHFDKLVTGENGGKGF